ncbi:Aldo/keto reductase [Phellopilus nigrolimitatus]|nr:Aldo/keto reductase [Phellopilus nigrolimitatus]
MSAVVLKRTGQKMPLVGFGLWKVPRPSCADTVYNAIKAGYRLFDGAGDYGNEKEAGEGVARAIKDGLVKRQDLFITSKLWNTFHAHDHAKALAKHQLELWGIDYFDLFLVHFPIALAYVDPSHRYPPEWWGDDKKVHLQNTPFQETWGAMEELVDEGLAKNIGISNCQGSIILDILRYARIEPQVLQIELHPYLTQEALVKLAKTLGIAITAYSSFGPQSYVELGVDKGVKGLLERDDVSSIAKTHERTPAQVLLRWATQQGVAVIPKSNDEKRVVANLNCDNFNLTETELKQLSSLNINLRLNDPAEIDPRLGIFA